MRRVLMTLGWLGYAASIPQFSRNFPEISPHFLNSTFAVPQLFPPCPAGDLAAGEGDEEEEMPAADLSQSPKSQLSEEEIPNIQLSEEQGQVAGEQVFWPHEKQHKC